MAVSNVYLELKEKTPCDFTLTMENVFMMQEQNYRRMAKEPIVV
jgi:hypothetical protein